MPMTRWRSPAASLRRTRGSPDGAAWPRPRMSISTGTRVTSLLVETAVGEPYHELVSGLREACGAHKLRR